MFFTEFIRFSIDTAGDADAIKQNGDKIQYLFNAMVYK